MEPSYTIVTFYALNPLPRIGVFFLVCCATTQLAFRLYQEQLQVVCSDKEAQKRLIESSGTSAMDLGVWGLDTWILIFFGCYAATQLALQLCQNIVLNFCFCMSRLVVDLGIVIICISSIIIIIFMLCSYLVLCFVVFSFLSVVLKTQPNQCTKRNVVFVCVVFLSFCCLLFFFFLLWLKNKTPSHDLISRFESHTRYLGMWSHTTIVRVARAAAAGRTHVHFAKCEQEQIPGISI